MLEIDERKRERKRFDRIYIQSERSFFFTTKKTREKPLISNACVPWIEWSENSNRWWEWVVQRPETVDLRNELGLRVEHERWQRREMCRHWRAWLNRLNRLNTYHEFSRNIEVQRGAAGRIEYAHFSEQRRWTEPSKEPPRRRPANDVEYVCDRPHRTSRMRRDQKRLEPTREYHWWSPQSDRMNRTYLVEHDCHEYD